MRIFQLHALILLTFWFYSIQAAEKHLYLRNVDEIFDEKEVQELAIATESGNLGKISRMVFEEKVPVDSKGYLGVTPLWWALQRQSLQGFEKLLELGANPNHQWDDGHSVMDHVVRMKSPEYLRLALKFGGDPNLLRSNPRGEGGETPIFRALYDSESNSETIFHLISKGADVNFTNPNGTTPAIIAAAYRRFDILYALLEKGADFQVKNDAGRVPVLHFVQLSLKRDDNLTDEQYMYREKVIKFLSDEGISFDR